MRILDRAAARMPRGKVLVMTAILIPAIMAFMALSVDVAVIATARAQLGTVTDAGALAGARKLADEMRVRGTTDLTSEMSNARTQAKTIGQDNKVLATTPVLQDNTNNSASGDIVIGYVDPTTHAWTSPPLADPTMYNAVQVTASRSSSHGGVVPAFFSRVWGYGGSTVTMVSRATAQNYPIAGFSSATRPVGGGSSTTTSSTPNADLLPIVLDVNTYKAMMQSTANPATATSTDRYTYNESTGTVTSGADGIYESMLYPVSAGLPGNWGTINVGVSNNSTSIISAQIRYGITPAQLATFPGGEIKLTADPSDGVPSITFSGNPGISAAMKDDLESIIGKPRAIPIYDNSGGDGNNAWYRVIAFQPCRILDVDFQGASKYVVIQPCLMTDATAIPQTTTTQWPSSSNSWGWNWSFTSGGLLRVHLTK